jgi:hypothetical protein
MSHVRIVGILAATAALHVIVLSLVFGLRHMGYMLAASVSSTLVWGTVFLAMKRRRPVIIITGIAICLAIQQLAYQAWKSELLGFWWPLAQFIALQFLVAYSLKRGGSTRE